MDDDDDPLCSQRKAQLLLIWPGVINSLFGWCRQAEIYEFPTLVLKFNWSSLYFLNLSITILLAYVSDETTITVPPLSFANTKSSNIMATCEEGNLLVGDAVGEQAQWNREPISLRYMYDQPRYRARPMPLQYWSRYRLRISGTRIMLTLGHGSIDTNNHAEVLLSSNTTWNT